ILMLRALPDTSDNSLTGACWIDIVDPIPAEIAAFEKTFGLRVPAKEEVSEIETTSRLRVEHGALYMSAPLILATGDEPWIVAPTGFVLSKNSVTHCPVCAICNFRFRAQGVERRTLGPDCCLRLCPRGTG